MIRAKRVTPGGFVYHVLNQGVVRGVFTVWPVAHTRSPQPVTEFSLWLRKPPLMDLIAVVVKHLYSQIDMG